MPHALMAPTSAEATVSFYRFCWTPHMSAGWRDTMKAPLANTIRTIAPVAKPCQRCLAGWFPKHG